MTHLLRPLRNRIANMVARAVVQMVSDAGGIQVMQLNVGPDETREGLERLQEYGFTSVPAPGAEVLALFVGGSRGHGVVVATDDRRYRPKNLQSGEVAIYTKTGQSILLKADGSIEVGGGTMQPAALGQDVRDELDDIRSKFASHTHAYLPGPGTATPTAATTTTLAAAKAVKSNTVKVKT